MRFILFTLSFLLITNISFGQNTEIDRLDTLISINKAKQSRLNDILKQLKKEEDSLLKIKQPLMEALITGDIFTCNQSSYIFKQPKSDYDNGYILNVGEKVKVLELSEGWYKVLHKGMIGYVNPRVLDPEDDVQARKLSKEFRRKDLENKFGRNNAGRIMAKQIWIGMTKEMAIESKGRPDDINRSVNEYGTSEQWIYGEDISNRRYLYFDDGVLTSWQD